MKQHVIPFLTFLVVFGAIGLFGLVAYGNRVYVTVRNVGHSDLESVVVDVTGQSYDLGSITAGQTKTTRVEPDGESHVELSVLGNHADRQILIVDCYFEPDGYWGSVTLDVDGGRLVSSQVNISLWPL